MKAVIIRLLDFDDQERAMEVAEDIREAGKLRYKNRDGGKEKVVVKDVTIETVFER